MELEDELALGECLRLMNEVLTGLGIRPLNIGDHPHTALVQYLNRERRRVMPRNPVGRPPLRRDKMGALNSYETLFNLDGHIHLYIGHVRSDKREFVLAMRLNETGQDVELEEIPCDFKAKIVSEKIFGDYPQLKYHLPIIERRVNRYMVENDGATLQLIDKAGTSIWPSFDVPLRL